MVEYNSYQSEQTRQDRLDHSQQLSNFNAPPLHPIGFASCSFTRVRQTNFQQIDLLNQREGA